MSSDGNLRVYFRDKIRTNAHWQSVETGLVTSGVPDANVCIDGQESWIEFKQTSGWKPAIRTEQIGWHLHRQRVGGVSFVAIRRWHEGGVRKGTPVDELWLCRGKYLPIIAAAGMLSKDIDWLGTWHHGPTNWDWEAVRRLLIARA